MLYSLQKRAVRIICSAEYPHVAHAAPLFEKLHQLDICSINTLFIAKFMYCYHKSLLPPLFRELYSKTNEIHKYNTKQAQEYRTTFCGTDIKQHTILYKGPHGIPFRLV